jgi:tetratricopeptide (TPR) repeat protein
MVSEQERGQLPLLLGMTFHRHREFERALQQLRRVQGKGDELPGRELFEARYAAARSQFWMGQYAIAAGAFGSLAPGAPSPEAQARVLYQQGRSYELLGQWRYAVTTFRRAYQAEPQGDWAAAALLSALRVEWRRGDEAAALPLLDLLASRREWRETLRRAALFLTSCAAGAAAPAPGWRWRSAATPTTAWRSPTGADGWTSWSGTPKGPSPPI